MSITPVAPVAPDGRRVRHQAREAITLMMFSALTSLAMATSLMLLASLGR